MSMEPSSTAFRRATALLTMIGLISLGISEPAAARGLAGMGRVQAVRVVPRIPVRPHAVRGDIARRPMLHARNPEPVDRRFHRRRLHRRAAWLSLPYDPYLIDTGQPGYAGQPDPGYFPDEYDAGPTVLPFELPACVRPQIIEIRPPRHATRLPRVIYGRPLAC